MSKVGDSYSYHNDTNYKYIVLNKPVVVVLLEACLTCDW